MNLEEAFASCEATVRRFDPDRYFASLFAPASTRRLLFALYAFNHEVARVGEQAREPMMAAVRLEWWREAVNEAHEGRPRAHPVAMGLAELFARAMPSPSLFDAFLEAREFDASADIFPDLAALESYCEATSGGMMRIASQLLAGDGDGGFLKHAGLAYGLVGLLRAIPFHASRRKIYLPVDLLGRENLSPDEIFAGREADALKRAIVTLVVRAREHIELARGSVSRGAALLAALPCAVAPLYAKQLTRRSYNPYRDLTDVPLFRRQIALAGAAMFGRL